ncbi:hypothetical protein ACVW0J_000265 [Bradyrhizobium sp. i1.7.7]
MRPPERQSLFTLELPNSTVVVGWPSTPTTPSGVPTGLVVTSAGSLSPVTLQAR